MDSNSAQSLCREIIAIDPSIRFAGIANQMGSLLAFHARQGLELLFSQRDLEDNALTAALRMKTRKDYEGKLGKSIYTFALYEKVKRASIPFRSGQLLLMVSFDTEAEHEPIILNKILPRLEQT